MHKIAFLATTASATNLRNPVLDKTHKHVAREFQTVHRVAQEFGYHEVHEAQDRIAVLNQMAQHSEILPGKQITFVPSSLLQSHHESVKKASARANTGRHTFAKHGMEHASSLNKFLSWYRQDPAADYDESKDYRSDSFKAPMRPHQGVVQSHPQNRFQDSIDCAVERMVCNQHTYFNPNIIQDCRKVMAVLMQGPNVTWRSGAHSRGPAPDFLFNYNHFNHGMGISQRSQHDEVGGQPVAPCGSRVRVCEVAKDTELFRDCQKPIYLAHMTKGTSFETPGASASKFPTIEESLGNYDTSKTDRNGWYVNQMKFSKEIEVPEPEPEVAAAPTDAETTGAFLPFYNAF